MRGYGDTCFRSQNELPTTNYTQSRFDTNRMPANNPDTLIIGVGNRMRRDDGAGLIVAFRLAQSPRDGVSIAFAEGQCYSLLELWREAEEVYLVDAVRGPPPGTILRIDAVVEQLPAAAFGASTHGFGLAQAIALARTLDRVPERLTVYAIAGADFAEGEGLTPAVEQAACEVVDRIRHEVVHKLW